MRLLARWQSWAYGLLLWLVPFGASFLFFDATGAPRIPFELFKTIMVLMLGGLATLLLVLCFKGQRPSLGEALGVGFLWFALNIGLDLLFFLPMAGMPFVPYVSDIGLRYLLYPIIAAGMAAMISR
jgi:hypothetical protein